MTFFSDESNQSSPKGRARANSPLRDRSPLRQAMAVDNARCSPSPSPRAGDPNFVLDKKGLLENCGALDLNDTFDDEDQNPYDFDGDDQEMANAFDRQRQKLSKVHTGGSEISGEVQASEIQYSNQGTPIADKSAVPAGFERPGAYSGAPGNSYDRMSSMSFGRLAHVTAPERLDSGIHSAKNLSQFGDLEQALSENDDEEESKDGISRKCSSWIIVAVMVVVVIIVAVVVAVTVIGDPEDDGSVEAPQTSVAKETQIPIPVDFDETVVPGLVNTTIAASTMEAIMGDPTSPQALAFTWMAEDPHLQDYSDSRRLQRFALATFYHSFGGPKWRATDEQAKHWLDYEVQDECNWLSNRNACQEAGLVRFLQFNRLSGFRGTMPPEILLLDRLENIDLNNNILNVPVGDLLPEEMPIGLRIFQCSQCRLKGSIPSTIGLLSNLQGLVLSENEITGSLPSEIGHLTRLDSMLMSQNQISGTLPSQIGAMTTLLNLYLQQNEIAGSIPVELARLSIMENLFLTQNALSQKVPSELGLLTNLMMLDIQGNADLSGALPTEIGLLQRLTSLDFKSSGLTGTVPIELGQLKALMWLGLSKNSFTGTVPTQLGTMSALRTLDLAFNGLTGTVPSELGQLVHLTWLSLSRNALTPGEIPSEILALPKLTQLDVFER